MNDDVGVACARGGASKLEKDASLVVPAQRESRGEEKG